MELRVKVTASWALSQRAVRGAGEHAGPRLTGWSGRWPWKKDGGKRGLLGALQEGRTSQYVTRRLPLDDGIRLPVRALSATASPCSVDPPVEVHSMPNIPHNYPITFREASLLGPSQCWCVAY